MSTRFRFLLTFAACWPLAAQSYVVSTVIGGSPAPATVSAASLALGGLGRVATDPSGNVYFTALNSVYKLDASGTATRVAGNGRPGYSGDGGPALSAQLNNPQGLAIDTQGDIFVADTGNQRIRLVANGIITTFAGNGTPGRNGDYGDPTQAQLHQPTAVALDTAGNLYIVDSANNIVREVSAGTIFGYAGNYIAGFSHDGDAASIAALNAPSDICFDSSGNAYIADTGNGRIRQVSAGGLISTFVGGGTTYTEGGLATASVLSGPHGVAVDTSGNLYIADGDSNHIYEVSKGNITTLAGTGSYGFSGDGSAAKSAQMSYPYSIAADPSGNIFFVDLFNSRIRKIASSNISTLAGNGLRAYSGDGGSAQNALMNAPAGVAAGPKGVIYVSDTNNQRVRMMGADGSISTVAGNGTAGFGGDGSAGASAQLAYPNGLATDSSGNLYIADTANNRIRKLANGVISTVAGNGSSGYSGDGSSAGGAALNSPLAIAVDGSGNLYIADYSNHAVREVSAGGIISTIAGTGIAGYSGDNAPANKAQLNGPSGVAVDSSGNIFIADSGNRRIRKITPDGNIATIAGDGNAATSGDGGPASAAELITPWAVSTDANGGIYVADTGASRIRYISAGGLIVTIAGTGVSSYGGDNGPALSAQFNNPSALSLDSTGNVFIADRNNNAVRMLQLVSAVPSVGTVASGASNLTGPISPGENVAIYGSGIGPAQLTKYQPDANGRVPTQTGGTTVYVNGVPAPVLYSWATQVGILVPYEVTPGPGAISIQYNGQISLDLPVTVAKASPGLFTADGSGRGQAMAMNEDGTVNSASGPVPQGHVITVYATGFGLVTPSVPDGSPDPRGFANPLLPVTATINGQSAIVQYAGGDTGLPAGTIRVDIRIPPGISGNAVPVVIQVGGASSQPGVSIAVK